MNSETSIIYHYLGGKIFFVQTRNMNPVVFGSLNKADVRNGFDIADSQITNFSALSTALFCLSYRNPINSN